MREIVVDLFAGGGGASTGIAWACGHDPDVAINHSPAAIAMHAANHPASEHYCESVFRVSPIDACRGRPVGLMWLSPDCTHHSKAKGGKPRQKKIRGLAWVACRWAKDVRPRVIVLENVEEFADWGPLTDEGLPCKKRKGRTFRAFVSKLRGYGYRVEWRLLVAADFGAPTTRRRLFMIARCDGEPIAWPDPTHGKGRAHPWRTAAEIIDWSLPCPSIFDRKKPLAEATLRRIATGVKRYVLDAARPFIVPVTHPRDSRVHSIDEPARTVTAANRGELALVTPFLARHFGASIGQPVERPAPTVTAGGQGHTALVVPTLIQTGYGERPGQAPRVPGLEKPIGTLVSGQKHALVAALITKHYGGVVGHEADKTLGTVTSRDHHALTTAFLAKLYGTSSAASVEAPTPTVTAGGNHLAAVHAFLVKYYGTGAPAQLGLPLGTATTRDRFALVTVDGEQYAIADIGMRMLQPHELFAAQGFPADYTLRPPLNGKPLNKTQQIELAGNSVCPPLAEAIVRANYGRAANVEAA